jgi:hypothetical protein
MSIRFAESGVANGRLSTARMGTFTTRIIRACLRPAAAAFSGKAVMAMMGFLSEFLS